MNGTKKKIILHWPGLDEWGPSPESESGHTLTFLIQKLSTADNHLQMKL